MTKEPNCERSAPEARYANYCEVGHNAFEFVLDFGQAYGNERVSCHSRMVMSPAYAKSLSETLADAIHAYEHEFGKIEDRRDG